MDITFFIITTKKKEEEEKKNTKTYSRQKFIPHSVDTES